VKLAEAIDDWVQVQTGIQTYAARRSETTPTIDLAFEKLGRLEAKNQLKEGLTKTISYFESHLVFTDRLLTYYSKALLS
jgi:hypothetical protein